MVLSRGCAREAYEGGTVESSDVTRMRPPRYIAPLFGRETSGSWGRNRKKVSCYESCCMFVFCACPGQC